MECTLYLAEGCNMHCRYCYEGKQKKNGLMDKGTVEHVLEYLVENALENEKIHLILLGGEPLLNKTHFSILSISFVINMGISEKNF